MTTPNPLSSALTLDKGVRNFRSLSLFFKEQLIRPNPVEPVFDLLKKLEEWATDSEQTPFPPEARLDEWADDLGKSVRAARPYLPLAYQEAYADPLVRELGHVVRSHDNVFRAHDHAEILVGAVAQHMRDNAVRHPARQFLAVVSNLYRSFLAPDKRGSAEVPLAAPTLPPLVVFFHDKPPSPPTGPATFTAAMNRLLCGADVGVVVLPGAYARVPLAWPPLAHETTGHGVLQADPDLLADLVDGVRALFGGGPLAPGGEPDPNQAMGLLWSYWVEEAASDVYGLLNIGPAYALNLAALIASQRSDDPQAKPMVGVRADDDPDAALDPHPVELLRLYLAVGVIENLVGLSPKNVRFYTELLDRIARLCGRNTWEVQGPKGRVLIRGRVAVERDRWVALDLSLPLQEAAESARRVGAYIASAHLGAFGNRTIQDVETWDEADELTARTIARALLDPPKVVYFEDGGRKTRSPVADALKHLRLPHDPATVAGVEKAIKGYRFDALSPEQAIPLQLGPRALTADLRAALLEDRVEAFAGDRLPSRVDPAQATGLDLIASLGDDGQLLAGATLAAVCDPTPESLRWINQRLTYALARSFEHDELLGPGSLHPMFVSIPPTEVTSDPLEQASATGVATPPSGTATG